MSSCPHLDMGRVKVPCLVDTGSMVSTITESFFLQHYEPCCQVRLRSCHWLQPRAANGLAIPYIDYLELNVELCSKLMTECRVLVVKNSSGDLASQFPVVVVVVVVVVWMNVIHRCYRELFGQNGLALFNLLMVFEAPDSDVQAFQKSSEI